MAMPPDYPSYPSRGAGGRLSRKLRRALSHQAGFQSDGVAPQARWHAMARGYVGIRFPHLLWSWQRALPTRPIVRPGRDRISIRAWSSTAASIAIPRRFSAKRVLVVGFGNSGGEIALDLANAGVDVALAVRSPVQILPRDLLGFPILAWAILYRRLPARLVDVVNAPILRLAIGRSRNWDCAALPRDRARWSRRMDAYR